jgi:type IV pilus assembly protein PilQ
MKLNILILSVLLFLSACAQQQVQKPLINTDELLEQARKEIEEMAKLGPKPISETEEYKKAQESKRKNITSEETRSFIGVGSKYKNLKQNVSINFNNVEIRNVLEALGEIGEINVLIGEEVSGTISIKLDNVAWDKAFQAVLDIKNFAGDFDTEARVIRVQSPEKLTQQYQFKSQMADTLSKRLALETSVEPVVTEMFKLFYITPAQAKKTLDELFSIGASGGAAGGSVQTTSQLKITIEDYTRSILVRGRKPDIDIVDKFVKQIDTITEQVLIEAFIVKASSNFERKLGSRIALATQGVRNGVTTTTEGLAGGAAGGAAGVSLGGAAGSLFNFPVAGATSGIGILRQIGATALKLELTALQTEGSTTILSNPKIFTINNQKASITQGDEKSFQSTSSNGTTTIFKEAALKLEVTPSVIGDGNVLINVKVNNDSFSNDTTINKMEINTNLLARDGDIIVIGGIKIDQKNTTRNSTPLFNLPMGKDVSDDQDELIVFIAPRIIK